MSVVRLETQLKVRKGHGGVSEKFYSFVSGEANITRASNGQIDSATEPGYRQNRRPSQSAVVAGVMQKKDLIF